ncbi:MAG TPA: hypothetical protein VFP37_05020, partial [Steroidobacteraceae bacterium]|nr:hypothetical protein [Steroidobacteraceae bacterium]
PLWFAEGLARFVETAEFRGNQQGTVAWLGLSRAYTGPRGVVPMERLLTIDRSSREYLDLATSSIVHHESWAMIHRGLVTKPEFGKQIFAYLEALNRLEPVEDAVQSSFGMSVEDLGKLVHSYLYMGTALRLPSPYKVVRIPVEPVPHMALPPRRPMSEAESLELLADIMLASGDNAERLPDVAAALQRAAPDSPAARSLLMRVAARNGQDATLEQELASIDVSSSDPKLLRGAGLALFERVGTPVRADFVNRSFELLDRALSSQPDDVEAAWAYAVLAAHLKRDLPAAEGRLAHVHALQPFNPHLAQAAALVQKAAGDAAKLQAALQETLKLSKTAEMTQWAKSRLDAVAKR